MPKIIKVTEKDVNIRIIPKLHTLSQKNQGKSKKFYCSEICAFDIETSVLHDVNQSIMYLWQFAIEDVVYIGRTWEAFKAFIRVLKAAAHGRTLVAFVHNLSYEIEFLSGIFHFANEDIFPTEPRHVLRANIENIEFRCSYRLTNLPLGKLTERYDVEHKKLKDFDYAETRYPWTELTAQELQYGINDVLGLVESIHAILALNNDDLYTLPLTSTGFVRRECKKAMRPAHLKIMECFPSYEVFQLLRAEFRGGNTHGNRYYSNEVIREKITSYDISSSYPSQQCTKNFPISPFEPIKGISCRLIDRIIEHGKAVLFEVELFNVELRNPFISVPYLAIAKCSVIKDVRNDNGRVLSASYLKTVLNEIDWQIVVAQYTFECTALRGYKANLGLLPKGLRQCNIDFFKGKTELKGIEGQELFYLKSKELLNGIYGMSVQNPAKGSILFNDCLYEDDTSKTEEQLLQEARKRAFTLYQYGCWTTAHARASLQAGIDLCGDDLIYVDTDSCKFRGEHDFTDYNKHAKAAAIKGGLYATDKKGITHYGGVFEHDATYKAFITQGAKKYAYEDEEGKIHVTVSGVGKAAGAAALTAAGGLSQFKSGFIFHNCGKTRSIYNDGDYGEYITEDGHKIYITRNVVIEEQDYTLSNTAEYTELIEQSKTYLKRVLQNYKNVQI